MSASTPHDGAFSNIMDPDHIPVLLKEVVSAINPRDGGIYVDGTFGAGGYSQALLEKSRCRVLGIDRDPEALDRGKPLVKQYKERLLLRRGRFSEMIEVLTDLGISQVDGIAFDLGVSSMQIDDRSRGFSFLRDGPLDMRMEKSGLSAADVINTMPEQELAEIIYKYGDERHSRRVAKAIVRSRKDRPFSRTIHLADVIRKEVKRAYDGLDPATRTFQALRIYVNDELGELERGLTCAERVLRSGGRLAVVCFHSLEDRIVKDFLKSRSKDKPRPSRHSPEPAASRFRPTFALVTKRSVVPTKLEVRTNPRARSARLRVGERTKAPALTALAGGVS